MPEIVTPLNAARFSLFASGEIVTGAFSASSVNGLEQNISTPSFRFSGIDAPVTVPSISESHTFTVTLSVAADDVLSKIHRANVAWVEGGRKKSLSSMMTTFLVEQDKTEDKVRIHYTWQCFGCLVTDKRGIGFDALTSAPTMVEYSIIATQGIDCIVGT